MYKKHNNTENCDKNLKENNISSEIEGLDDDSKDENYIYIKHFSSPEKVELNENSYKLSNFIIAVIELDQTIINNINSPIEISEGSLSDFNFVVSYLKFYSDKSEELSPPEKPLLNKDIKSELELEYHIFKQILEFDNKIDKKIIANEKLSKLGKLLTLANFLGMDTLEEKLAAIAGHFLMELDIYELYELNSYDSYSI